MHVVVILGKVTPHHIARLEAAGREGEARGHHLSVVEIADSQNDYIWPENVTPMKHVRQICLFPRCDYWSLSYRQIRVALHEVLGSLRPDVVVVNGWGFKDALAALGWSITYNIPRVVTSDSYNTGSSFKAIHFWVKRLLVRQFQAGLAAGSLHIQYLVELGLPKERCFIGLDVVDNTFFAQASAQWKARKKQHEGLFSLCSSLRLLPKKNVLFVLNVLAHQAKQWQWVIAGYGPQRQEVERHIAALGLQNRVRLLGAVAYGQLPKVYAEADAYLQPSLVEAWGLAVNEAMACGLPVIVSTHCGCHEDLVQNDINGYTFDPNNPNSLATTLDRLAILRSRWEKLGQASISIIAQWGLDLYARNLWLACNTAMSCNLSGSPSVAIKAMLSRLL